MLNSGRRGKRAPDGYGIQSVNEKFNQANYPIPIIDSWSITDGSYNPTDDTALDTAGGQTVVVYGSGFTSGVTVNINGTNISPVTLLDSNRLTFTSPTLASASYTIYVSNTDGATAIYVPGLVYSGLPTWSSPSAGSIGTNYETKSTSLLSSNTFIATGDAPITYSITSGNLPSGVTLSSGGVLSGSLPATESSTTYSFTITASDAQNQDSSRSFSLTINPDVVTWVAPTQNGSLTVYETQAFSTPLSATSAAGYGVMYTANTLPTGITLSTDSGALNGYANTVGTTNAMLTATANTTGRYSTSNVLFTVTQDSVTWSSPANNTTYSLGQSVTMPSVPLAATSAAGYGVQYTANSLPTGVTLSGNTISGTPTVMGTSTTEIIATANTTNRVSYVYINWSVTIAVDTYFANTVMLLSANSQLQTASFITDTSINNLQLTIAGDTRPSNFNPYRGGYYSNYFDGNGDYLNVASSTAFGFGTGDFTIEFWINPTNAGAALQQVYDNRTTTDSKVNIGVRTNTITYCSGSTVLLTSAASSISNGKWQHVAVVRYSGTTKIYINGVQSGSSYADTNNYSTTAECVIATVSDARGSATYSYNGYISNLRVVKGTAIYTSAFTPSTTPLTSVSGTSLLTCQSPRLIDNSNSNFTITKNGDTTVSSAYPFPTPTTSSYNTQYSTYFDGTGDYLSLTNTSAFDFGTGDFTIEGWVYLTTLTPGGGGTSDGNTIISAYPTSGTITGWNVPITSTGYLKFQTWVSGTTQSLTATNNQLSINTWYHIAVVRNAGTYLMFVNGVATTFTGTMNQATNSGGSVKIGGLLYTTYINYVTGHISNIRIVKGTALYTTSFTPSTTPLTTTSQGATASQVSLLTCQNSTLIDNSTNAFTITSNGQAQPIAVSPFTMTTANNTVTSLGSAYFDGTGDYLQIASNPALQLTGDFTVEMWCFPTVLNTNNMLLGSDSGANSDYLNIAPSTLGMAINGGLTYPSWSYTFTTNRWYHIVITRSGSNLNAYVNGTALGAQTYAQQFLQSGVGVQVGRYGYAANPWYFTGYITDLRITKGVALYTANFLPPQAPLTPVANTQLLTCQTNGGATNNGFVDQSSFNNIITRNGNPTQGTFSPHNTKGWSVLINALQGNGGTVKIDTNTNLNSIAGDFTWETWAMRTKINSLMALMMCSHAATTTLVRMGSDGATSVLGGGITALQADNRVFADEGKWFHIAISRQSGTVYVHINGVQVSSFSYATAVSFSGGSGSSSANIGAYNNSGNQEWVGYVSNMRIVTGRAVYDINSTFTPSTTPLTAVSGTQLLAFQDNRFIDNSKNHCTFTTGGTIAPAIVPTTGIAAYKTTPTSYSTYFDGTGDYATASTSVPITTGEFTIEFWMYVPASALGVRRNLVGNYIWSFGDNGGWNVFFKNDNKLYLAASAGVNNAVTEIINSTDVIPTESWTHVAIVRNSSNQINMYFNGVVSATPVTYSASLNQGTMPVPAFRIGYALADSTVYDQFIGHISNVRVVNGTAIVPPTGGPTSPLTAVANTVVLTCQSSTLVDNGPNKITLTTSGDCRPVTYNPFGETSNSASVYTATDNGGSIYFDGTGDYLSFASSYLPTVAGVAFTFEMWVYPTRALASGNTLISSGNMELNLDSANAGQIRFDLPTGVTNVANSGTYRVQLNAWNHIVLTRSAANVYTIYLNGVGVATGSSATAITTLTTFGYSSVTPFMGYVSGLRSTIGTQLYTANFLPPEAPATPTTTISANTYASSLCVTGTSGGIVDISSAVNLETVGDAKVTSFSPYNEGYYSNYFDGTGDYLQTPASSATTLIGGSGSISTTSTFTIECWIYQTQRQTYDYGCMIGDMGTNGSIYWGFGPNATGKLALRWNDGATKTAVGDSTIPLNTWTHIALSIDSGTIRMFVNGVLQTITGTSSTTNQSGTLGYLLVGGFYTFGTTYGYYGNISNLRITKSALYSTTFTPSIIPLTTVANTSLLTCQSNKFVDNSTNAITLTVTGDTAVKPQNPFQRTSGQSYYFDGTGDSLYVNAALPSTATLHFGASDYTIEYWVNPTSLATAATHFNLGLLKANTTASTGATTVWGGAAGTTLLITGAAITGNAWTHVAITRQTGVGTTLWINGTRSGAIVVDSTAYANSTMFIGSTNAATYPFTGYLTDVRIARGTARYTANNTAYLNNGYPYMGK